MPEPEMQNPEPEEEVLTHFGLFPSALKWQMACELTWQELEEHMPMARLFGFCPLVIWQLKMMDKGPMKRPFMVDNEYTK